MVRFVSFFFLFFLSPFILSPQIFFDTFISSVFFLFFFHRCVVYHNGRFLITLSDAHGEHELLNTRFPIISNPHKEFPIEKYTNPSAPYKALTLMYSPMSGSAGEKTADIVDVSSGEEDIDDMGK